MPPKKGALYCPLRLPGRTLFGAFNPFSNADIQGRVFLVPIKTGEQTLWPGTGCVILIKNGQPRRLMAGQYG